MDGLRTSAERRRSTLGLQVLDYMATSRKQKMSFLLVCLSLGREVVRYPCRWAFRTCRNFRMHDWLLYRLHYTFVKVSEQSIDMCYLTWCLV